MLRPNKSIMFIVSLLCAVIVFAVICIPATLIYEWLAPVTFWQRFAFGISVFAVLCVPFGKRTTRKTSKPGTVTPAITERELESWFKPRPASCSHREMTQAMRDAAERYGLYN